MADVSWLHAVPIGLLMFAGTTFGVVRRSLGKRAARTAFPNLGARLGLAYSAPESPGAAGTLKGTLGGYRVRVESETRARVVVSFRRQVPLDVRNYEHWKRVPAGYEVVAFEAQKLNHWLKNRYAVAAMRAALAYDARFRTMLAEHCNNPHLREFAVTSDRIELVFEYGVRGLFPTAAAEHSLTSAIALAQHIEQLWATVVANGEHQPPSGDEGGQTTVPVV